MKKLVVIAAMLLPGCITLNTSKSMVVPPSESKVIVTSKAETHCQDFILFFHCTLKIDLQQTR